MSKVYLVTGSNVGLGRDACRQLALLEETKRVFLACRSRDKAQAAIDLLVQQCDCDRQKLEFVRFDACDGKEEMKDLVALLKNDTLLDGVILNAGGPGCDFSGKPIKPNNVMSIVQVNLIGHIHLLEQLSNHLKSGCHVVFSGSESSRGFLGPTPVMGDHLEAYQRFLDGTLYGRVYDAMDAYGRVKGVGTLFFKKLARSRPNLRIYTVSPGSTFGTSVLSQGQSSLLTTLLTSIVYMVWCILDFFGYMHTLEQGAERYVKAVTGEYDADFDSGAFIASAYLAAGPVTDQCEIVPGGSQYSSVERQDLAYEALATHLGGIDI